jgi:hypothetical protein
LGTMELSSTTGNRQAMSNDKIKTLLESLQQEIANTDINEDTRSLMQALESDIQDLLDVDNEKSDTGSVIENAKYLETQFAAEHPVAERFLREIVETLGRIGV